ncbi:SDR family NAD(P)-dependent oxidoreductase [Paenibacillus hexagrammi]|uniref:SDR family oxidoreductase n=1 Tax=Paenibacillus hexagrammi TaxID=2908839 RepID=A0ABY3SES4_9BACL|nr:SDR family oxidoreductase [Paenibacillus sp. YPD9-1]UJF32493.1 SDR family oxidoreductase [Paenibacillus sp. YPD9-1]
MNKTALITGASSGIGEVFAHRLAAQGYRLILAARSQDTLERLARELAGRFAVEVQVITADLSLEHTPSEIFRQVQELGWHVDLLVNNAGFGLSGEFLSHSAEEYRQQIKLNVASLVDMTHLFLPPMLAKGDGAIINLASLLSFFPFPYCSVYSATKTFVLSFSESLWEEYRHQGIKVLALCPGPTDTQFFTKAKEVELDRKRSPEQVVDTALKALSQNKSFVIDGKLNVLNALLARLLPRKTMVSMLGSVMRKSLASRAKG